MRSTIDNISRQLFVHVSTFSGMKIINGEVMWSAECRYSVTLFYHSNFFSFLVERLFTSLQVCVTYVIEAANCRSLSSLFFTLITKMDGISFQNNKLKKNALLVILSKNHKAQRTKDFSADCYKTLTWNVSMKRLTKSFTMWTLFYFLLNNNTNLFTIFNHVARLLFKFPRISCYYRNHGVLEQRAFIRERNKKVRAKYIWGL